MVKQPMVSIRGVEYVLEDLSEQLIQFEKQEREGEVESKTTGPILREDKREEAEEKLGFGEGTSQVTEVDPRVSQATEGQGEGEGRDGPEAEEALEEGRTRVESAETQASQGTFVVEVK